MKYTGHIALVFCLVLAGYLFFDRNSGKQVKRTGVVRMEKLVYEFVGMKEATNKYNEKLKTWDKETEVLQTQLSLKLGELRADSASGNKQKLTNGIRDFARERQRFADFVEGRRELAEMEDKNMTLGVVTQLNDYMREYAIKEGYDLVLCTDPERMNVAFSVDRIDITQQVLDFANRRYEDK